MGPPLITEAEGATIAVEGTFEAAIGGEVDGDANPASGSDLVFTAVLHGELRTEDLVCGIADGQVTQPAMLSINGSTFGAIRIVAGTIGNEDLPASQAACTPTSNGDAGAGSGDFDDYWQFHLAHEHDRVHRSHYADGAVPNPLSPSRPRLTLVK